jgi:arylsulfatase A-like enzyme
MHTWPLIFDYAKSAGFDTAFWTSQNMFFGNAHLWVKNLGVSHFVSATQLDPAADLDTGAPEARLAEHVANHVLELREPFLAVVQLSNTHFPYLIDAAAPQPFQPTTTSKAPEDNASFRNYYQNSVYQQDRHVARLLASIRERPGGEHTVVVVTSDHGEAFREHGQMGHTFSVFDEEVHVPLWIDAPVGTLSAEEVAALTGKRDAPLFHIDLVPTLLDLLGVAEAPALTPLTAKLLGHSLLRPALTQAPVPLSNCGGVWSCAFENWGYMAGSRKLSARAWDTEWQCFDVLTDPEERRNLGAAACPELVNLAQGTFGRLPGAERH